MIHLSLSRKTGCWVEKGQKVDKGGNRETGQEGVTKIQTKEDGAGPGC